MHVNRLDCHEGAERLGVLGDDLRHQPWVDQGVIGVDEDALAPGPFAPLGDLHHLRDIGLSVESCGGRTRGEYVDAWGWLAMFHDLHSLTLFRLAAREC